MTTPNLMEQSNDRAKIARITARAWTDPVFKAELLANPAKVMRDYELTVPPGVTIQMHENTADVQHVVLPRKPDDLSAAETENPDPILPSHTIYTLFVR